MAASQIGKVTAPSGKVYEVRWDASSKDLYIKYTGSLMPMSEGASTHIGRASTATEAMTKAEAAVYNK
jgi:hypothetical protein